MSSARQMAGLKLVPMILAAVLLALAVKPAASVAEGAPAWQIAQITYPTNLIPGSENPFSGAEGNPSYSAFITNVGGAPAKDFIVTDLLPSGVSSAGTPEIVDNLGRHACDVSGQLITCEVAAEVPSSSNFRLNVPLKVSDSPPQSVISNEIKIEGGGAPPASSRIETTISTALPSFALLPGSGLSAGAFDEAGDPPLAGSHPFDVTLGIEAASKIVGHQVPVEGLRDIDLTLPKGLVVNPRATLVRCTEAQAAASLRFPNEYCPVESQVGNLIIEIPGLGRAGAPVYNMVPPAGAAAELSFGIENAIVHIVGGVDGDFRLTANTDDLLTRFETNNIRTILWGNPSDPRHDSQRFGFGCETGNGCGVKPSPRPFLTQPTSCTEPLRIDARVSSWRGSEVRETRPFSNREFEPYPLEGCNALAFNPTIESKATTTLADSPSGLDFSLHQPQDESFEGRATAALKDAKVTLPEGMTLNAAAANGLGSCTEEQMGYQPKEGKIRFATTPQSCPESAKIGTIEVNTPLLDETLPGAIYVAKPFDNPFGSLLSIYLAIESDRRGIHAKLAGKVEPDPQTGQLTATFTENPELPIEDIDLHFFNGSNAPLKTPFTCGTKTTTSTLTPWSTPEGADTHPTGSFQTQVAASGTGTCPTDEAAAPKAVAFSAGTNAPLAGLYSPFSIRIARTDGTQHIAGVETTLPEGLLGKLAGIAYCPEAGIGLAKSREAPEEGRVEQASPSCPKESEVGTVEVTAGAGIAPIPVSGHAYLAGPYHGAPLSLVVIVPAVAGPFDLGNVVNRVALNIGDYDARIHAVSDPLPTIVAGIPLDVRSIELKLNRSDFTLNPTSCEAKSIEGSVTTQPGQTAPLKNSFQVGECKRLGFKPKLKLSLKGATKRAGHPALKAVVTYPAKGEYANIARAQVSLPHSEFLDQGNIGTVCTQPQLKSQTCPARSIYGKAKAWSPLLDKPLEGPVYLGAAFGHPLPDLVADLNGQVRILLHGKVDTDKADGIRNTFEAVPDAPVSRFVLEMKGGKKFGLLENSENICRKKQKAGAEFVAQNGKVLTLRPTIANSCNRKKAKKKHGRH